MSLNEKVFGFNGEQSQINDNSQSMMLFQDKSFNQYQSQGFVQKKAPHNTYRKQLDGFDDEVDDDFSSTENDADETNGKPELPHKKDKISDVADPSDFSSPQKVKAQIEKQEFIVSSLPLNLVKSTANPNVLH